MSDAPTAQVDARHKLLGLEIGRAIAAISVLISHAVAHPYGGAPGAFHLLSRYGGTLFFVISGYIMVLTTGRGRLDPFKFMDRRIRRIVPIYYVANALILATVLVAPNLFKNTLFDLKHLILSIFFIPAYRPDGSGYIFPFFRLGWTLNYEMFFYLMFAACFAMQARTRAIVLTALFSVLMIIGFVAPFQAAIPRFYTQVDLTGFLAGVWLGIMALETQVKFTPKFLAAAALASAIALALMAYHYHELKEIPITQFMVVAICAIHILLLVALIDVAERPVPAVMILIAEASYSIYLFHMFAVGAVTAVARKLPSYMLYPMMGVSVAAGIGIGVLAYIVIEKPLNARFRRRSSITRADAAKATVRAHETIG